MENRQRDFGHGGNLGQLSDRAGLLPDEIADFSANINPLGAPEWLRSIISSQIASIAHYPDPDCLALKEAIAAAYSVGVDEILVGNGSTELLYLIPRALEATRAVIPVPAYVDYVRSAELANLPVERVTLKERD